MGNPFGGFCQRHPDLSINKSPVAYKLCRAYNIVARDMDCMYEPARSERPAIKLWQLPGVDGVELIRAAAITQPLPKQFHEEFILGTVERGGHAMMYRGTTYTAAPGSLILTQPGDVTTCGPSAGQGRTFSAIHLQPSFVADVASALVDRPGQMPSFS